MTADQVWLNGNKTEASFIVELKKKPIQELLWFISNPWSASILSPEEIEGLYQNLQQKDLTPLVETEENFVEIGLD